MKDDCVVSVNLSLDVHADCRPGITSWAGQSHPTPDHGPQVRIPGYPGAGCDLPADKDIHMSEDTVCHQLPTSLAVQVELLL